MQATQSKAIGRLVLSRRPGESVLIGGEDGGKVTVFSVNGDKVRLVFDFPMSTSVNREEVVLELRRAEAAGEE